MAVSVTYNNWDDLVYLYTDDGGIFSSNLATSSAFDYFPDDGAVNDAIYFTYNPQRSSDSRKLNPEFKGVRLYVGTAFVADSQTFVWEYYDGSAWVAFSNVVNNDAILSTGQQDIDWDVPIDWGTSTINSIVSRWARCRITAVTNCTEGGSQSTQTVKVGDHVIQVTGGTSATPATLNDVVTADTSGGWGLVTKTGTFYFINAHFRVGDGTISTYLTVNNGQILQVGTDASNYEKKIFYKTASSTFQLGTQSSGSSQDGAVFICHAGYYARLQGVNPYNTHLGTYKIYSSYVYYAGAGFHDPSLACTFEMRDSVWNARVQGTLFFSGANTLTIVNSYLDVNGFLYIYNTGTITIDGLLWSDRLVKVLSGGIGTTVTLSNLTFTSSQELWTYYGVDVILINQSGITVGKCWTSNPATENITLKYTFSLNVIDNNGDAITGATVVIKDIDGTEVFSGTTDANGDIVEQTIIANIFTRVAAGSGYYDTDTPHTPHTVTITKSGYIKKVIKYTMDEKRTEVEALENVVKWIKPENVDDIIWNLDNTNQSNKFLWTKV